MSRGIDYGELGQLLSNGKIKWVKGTPQFTQDWDSLILAYADYKRKVQKVHWCSLFKEWGIPYRHWTWFNRALRDYRSRQRIREYMLTHTFPQQHR